MTRLDDQSLTRLHLVSKERVFLGRRPLLIQFTVLPRRRHQPEYLQVTSQQRDGHSTQLQHCNCHHSHSHHTPSLHSFIPGLKPSFSANPSHRSTGTLSLHLSQHLFSFLLLGITTVFSVLNFVFFHTYHVPSHGICKPALFGARPKPG